MGNAWWEGKNQWWGVREPDGNIHPSTLKLTRKDAIAARMKTIDDAVRIGAALNMPIPRSTWQDLQSQGEQAVKVCIVEHTAERDGAGARG